MIIQFCCNLVVWPITHVKESFYFFNSKPHERSKLKQVVISMDNVWMNIKMFEGGLEAVSQLCLIIWLEKIFLFHLINLSLNNVLTLSGEGLLSVITIGILPASDTTFISLSLGKILFTWITISFTMAIIKVTKPSLSFTEELPGIFVMFVSYFLLISVRLSTFLILVLWDVKIWKYVLFILLHLSSVFIIVYREVVTKKKILGFEEYFHILLSSVVSTLTLNRSPTIKNEFSDHRTMKYNIAFQLLILIEYLIMICIFLGNPSEFSTISSNNWWVYQLCWINLIAWIASNLLQVTFDINIFIHFKIIFK